MKKRTAFLTAVFAICLVRVAYGQISPEQEKQLFSRVDEMLATVSEITGMKVVRPVPRALISREKIREYVEQRMAKALKPEEIRGQEILLKKFGFLSPDFDLKSQTVDLLSEQAAAFYDFREKKLYLAAWTPSALQDIALVHELAHALADQHFKLKKFLDRGEDDDEALARQAIVEGQASWVMSEYMARQAGQSLKHSPQLAAATIEASGQTAKQFPVFGAAPLYMQETLMFPYTAGMLFQQAVVDKLGRAAFVEVFRRPPASSQQVLHPERYFENAAPTKPALPSLRLPGGYKKLLEGTLGELDHQILLQQYAGQEEARRLGPAWRGSRYALWENGREKRSVLHYAVEWTGEAEAARYFADYRKICGRKWKRLEIESEQAGQVTGVGDDGRFQWTLRSNVFSSVEGLPQ
ncbi:MAG: hypothetical protein HY236_12460 [Acidobacteria bacterium]|nr:hypothetical protein [Acidobacteriota bacterium]